MFKFITLLIVLFLGGSLYAQVGINTVTPSATLDIASKGNTSNTKALKINNSSGTEAVTVLDNGNVGIGNTTPTTKLDINNGTTVGAIKIVDGTQGEGKVLTSDANGVGSWSPTSATSLYFFSSSPYTATTDFKGTNNPLNNSPAASNIRYLTTGTVTNLGPATTITSGTSGLSYSIPANGIYRITLYVDQVPSNMSMVVSVYRGATSVKNNSDTGNGSPLVMINVWNLEAGDIVIPYSGAIVPSGSQMVETTFTIERVN